VNHHVLSIFKAPSIGGIATPGVRGAVGGVAVLGNRFAKKRVEIIRHFFFKGKKTNWSKRVQNNLKQETEMNLLKLPTKTKYMYCH